MLIEHLLFEVSHSYINY